MLNFDAYRSCQDYKEIIRLLQKSSTLQENFLWQSGPSGKSIINIHHLEIDFLARGVAVHYDSRKYRLDTKRPLYVKLEYRDSVFKVSQYQLSAQGLHFAFPEEIKSLELRRSARMSFKEEDERFISIMPSFNSFQAEGRNDIRMRVHDVSASGIGITVSESNRSFLKNNRFLWITQLQDHILKNPILGEVVYITADQENRFSRRRQKDLKVGLKLSSPVPAEILQDFIQ